jgi:hypothetical protein
MTARALDLVCLYHSCNGTIGKPCTTRAGRPTRTHGVRETAAETVRQTARLQAPARPVVVLLEGAELEAFQAVAACGDHRVSRLSVHVTDDGRVCLKINEQMWTRPLGELLQAVRA